jgi:predicted phosphodiesterase
MTNDLKWMMVSDVHFPRHDARKVELFLKVMKWWKPNAVDLLGDIDDADSTSRWADGLPDENVSIMDGGVSGTRQFLADINAIVPNADKHFHDGNHGWTRHGEYLAKKAPTFLDFVTPDSLYEYKKHGFNWHLYNEPPVKRFGDMYGHHGESISKHSGESVRNDVNNWGVSLVRGHSHRMGAYFQTYNLSGQELRGYEIGHLCDETQMDYSIQKNWQAGFAVAHVVNDYPHMQLIQITRDYTCVVDGKIFSV